MDIPGKRWQAPFVRSTRRAVPAKGACHLFPKAENLFLPLALEKVLMFPQVSVQFTCQVWGEKVTGTFYRFRPFGCFA